jgi:hypothetical protein
VGRQAAPDTCRVGVFGERACIGANGRDAGSSRSPREAWGIGTVALLQLALHSWALWPRKSACQAASGRQHRARGVRSLRARSQPRISCSGVLARRSAAERSWPAALPSKSNGTLEPACYRVGVRPPLLAALARVQCSLARAPWVPYRENERVKRAFHPKRERDEAHYPKSWLPKSFFGARPCGFCRKRDSSAPTLLQQRLEGVCLPFAPRASVHGGALASHRLLPPRIAALPCVRCAVPRQNIGMNRYNTLRSCCYQLQGARAAETCRRAWLPRKSSGWVLRCRGEHIF